MPTMKSDVILKEALSFWLLALSLDQPLFAELGLAKS